MGEALSVFARQLRCLTLRTYVESPCSVAPSRSPREDEVGVLDGTRSCARVIQTGTFRCQELCVLQGPPPVGQGGANLQPELRRGCMATLPRTSIVIANRQRQIKQSHRRHKSRLLRPNCGLLRTSPILAVVRLLHRPQTGRFAMTDGMSSAIERRHRRRGYTRNDRRDIIGYRSWRPGLWMPCLCRKSLWQQPSYQEQQPLRISGK
jgi:hypothetical protein